MKLGGRSLERPPGVPVRDWLSWYGRRGLIPAFRGLARGALLGAVRHPFALGKNVRILNGSHLRLGKGVVIGDNSWLSCLSERGVDIEDGVTIREGAWLQCTSSLDHLGEGLRVGSQTYIGPRSYLGVGGYISIGERCDFGGGVSLIAENHVVPERGLALRGGGVTRRGIIIEDDCWLGNGVTILDGVTVGHGCVVAAGAVVTRDFPPLTVIAGIPARRVRDR